MNRTSIRRTVKAVALFSLLGIATVGLSQCRLVGDTVTGVELETSTSVAGRSDCVKDCNDTFKAAKRAEDARHKAAARACGRDKVCKNQEQVTYKRNLLAIVNAMKVCKRSCYNEGSGVGGR
jgi:hypothetical protein